ncbi:MAG: class I SAM-dependent methyltransferase [Myxococcales bacterium]|nr:class I SAM-dependent methyltransferase [Myxococcales bacterium]
MPRRICPNSSSPLSAHTPTGDDSRPQQLPCPLCGGASSEEFFVEARRSYLRCRVCLLIFVPTRFHLSESVEKAEYELHENNVRDAGYRRFLGRLATPLLALLESGSKGLDFGCGPGPALSSMIEEDGHEVALYDRYFVRDESVFNKSFDFITVTEVVEHLSDPQLELERLWGMLREGGVLGIMTKLARDREAFASWHYKNDPTHIAFFSEQTFRWLAEKWSARIDIVAADVVLLTKLAA